MRPLVKRWVFRPCLLLATDILTSTCPYQRKRGSSVAIPGTSIGKSQVLQIISALEHHRFHHQHEHKGNVDAQTNLCTDNRIRVFETASKHNEPKRAAMAQALKAARSSAG